MSSDSSKPRNGGAVKIKQISIHLTIAQLKAIEYAGVKSWGYEESGCPVCGVAEEAKHLDNCWIGAAIKRLNSGVRP